MNIGIIDLCKRQQYFCLSYHVYINNVINFTLLKIIMYSRSKNE